MRQEGKLVSHIFSTHQSNVQLEGITINIQHSYFVKLEKWAYRRPSKSRLLILK